MNYVWINDVLITGARQLLDPVSPDSHKTISQNQPYGISMTASGGGADD